MAPDDLVRQAELLAEHADLVLVEVTSGSMTLPCSISAWMRSTRLWWVLIFAE